MAPSALEGLKVIELGNFVSAAYCAKLLGDLGAEVVKIEPPSTGDEARAHGPFPDDRPDPERSGLFLYLNINKLGVTLDPAKKDGRDLFLRLVKQADVLVENQHPRRMAALTFSYETLREINPRLIMTSITPFGQSGPYRDFKGHAINAIAASGVTFRMGDPARPPLASPLSRADYLGGLNGASATMVAVMAREATGRGQHVDISEAHCIATFVQHQSTLGYMSSGWYEKRSGTRIQTNYPWEVMPCKDGFILFMLVRDDFRKIFFEQILGAPDWWRNNPRYQDYAAMGKEYPEEVDELIKPWFLQRTKKEIWEICRQKRVPVHPIHTIEEGVNSEHFAARGHLVEVQVPGGPTVKVPGAPHQLGETPWQMRRPAPRLGEHNAEVYGGRLGLNKAAMAGLARAGVI